MDAIEEQVQLPSGASPLQDYARHYAVDANGRMGAGRGRIIGVYLLPEPPRPTGPGIGCSEVVVQPNGQETLKDVPCPLEGQGKGDVSAGERRWFDDVEALPTINDGGCMMVTVIFNPSTQRVELAECNGGA
ncbi:hypothetical protein GCM10007925_09470 [Sphingomonas astaxanthinifaciens DSM 22298]|uniref:Uncharacterized protein n=1 Tax=Sphingomonas astaxanthinifaciens DSM 22298 TaxID=1123267 RepID=A0ABQ5Z742_9SPHN|nr:hypothetical protein GCM10007925_09470 [Sphingomonas astaxanthinifaciens DSM 22298]